MLQFSTPDGMKSWPKLPDIPDWHQDQESSLRLAANSLIPDGVDPATAEVTIQARGFARRGNGSVTSLSQMIERDRAAAASGTQVKSSRTSPTRTARLSMSMPSRPLRRGAGRRWPIRKKAIICWPSP